MPFIILGVIVAGATIKATHVTLKFAFNLAQGDYHHTTRPKPRKSF